MCWEHQLRADGVQIYYLNSQESVKLSAYADDVTIVIRGDYDVEMVKMP